MKKTLSYIVIFFGFLSILYMAVYVFNYFSKDGEIDQKSKKGLYAFVTKSGKKIEVKVTPSLDNLTSTLEITTEGFTENSPILLEKNTFDSILFEDLNGDSYEELILVTKTAPPQNYGDITVFTTYGDTKLQPVETPSITEELADSEGPFFGYKGNDSFSVEKKTLWRTFTVNLLDNANEENPDQETIVEPVAESEEPQNTEGVTESTSTLIGYEENKTEETSPLLQDKRAFYELSSDEGYFYMTIKEVGERKEITASSTAQIAGTSWGWLSSNSKGVVVMPEQNVFNITFNEDQTFSATTDCNNLSGQYLLAANNIRFGTFSDEGKVCESSKENTFKELLTKVETYVIKEDQLVLNLAKQEGVLIFIHK